MADTVNPKDFTATTDIDGTEEFPLHEVAGWRKATLNTIKTWLATFFDAAGAAVTAMSAHNLAWDHATFITAEDVPVLVTRETLELSTTDTVEFSNVIITVNGKRYKFALDVDDLLVLEEV